MRPEKKRHLPSPWLYRYGIPCSLWASAIACVLLSLCSPCRREFIGGLLWITARIDASATPTLQRLVDPVIPPGSLIIAGDSFAAMLPTSSWRGQAINLGIGGATVAQTREQLIALRSLTRARALVLLVGSNDLVHSSIDASVAQLRKLLATLPPHLPVCLCTVPPIDPKVHHQRHLADIKELNIRWAKCAADRPLTRLVRVEAVLADGSGSLKSGLHQNDGLHLNIQGNELLVALINQNLATLP